MKQILKLDRVWNEVAYKENKPLVKRDYCYASEIGGAMYDRILKMNAVEYTNPPNIRSLRKFLAGNIWEYVVKQVLLASGVFKREEVKCDSTPYSGLVSVHGRFDFHVGGVVDIEHAFHELKSMNAPEYLYILGEKIIYGLKGAEFEESIFELKSCSSFAMDKLERTNAPLYNNESQAYYYKRSTQKDAQLCYICKDDNRMKQFSIGDCEQQLHQDLKKISDYLESGETPPLEPIVKWSDADAKFEKNFNVEYSPYLSHYGFDTPDDYRGAVSCIESWNRVILRFAMAEYGYKDAKGNIPKITEKNKEVRREIESKGYNFNDIIEAQKKAGLEEENEPE
jgi:hypothetical protein